MLSGKKTQNSVYKHFNAAVCVEAVDVWVKHLNQKGEILDILTGAMSTAEIGISLAEIIRQDKVYAISCTGTHLEEDLFNLVAYIRAKEVYYESFKVFDVDLCY